MRTRTVSRELDVAPWTPNGCSAPRAASERTSLQPTSAHSAKLSAASGQRSGTRIQSSARFTRKSPRSAQKAIQRRQPTSPETARTGMRPMRAKYEATRFPRLERSPSMRATITGVKTRASKRLPSSAIE